MPDLTVKQHYVWQHYLRAWCMEDLVWCKRSDKPKAFAASTHNVAAERYFYEAFELTDDDVTYLEGVISRSNDKRLQANNLGWITSFQTSFAIRREMSRMGLEDQDRANLAARLREIERTLGETFHTRIEAKAIPLLDSLRVGNTSFFEDTDLAISFITYLSHQFFRTARMRNIMLAIPNPLPHDVSRTWPIEAFIYATNLGASLVRGIGGYKIVLLENGSPIHFVTGDQPVINLLDHEADDVEFYYPLKPDLAMIFTANRDRYRHSTSKVSQFEVESYNHKIFVKSDSQIFGRDPGYLNTLAQLPKWQTLT